MAPSLLPMELAVCVLSWISVVCAGLGSLTIFRIAGTRPLVGAAYPGLHLAIFNFQQGVFTSAFGFLMPGVPAVGCYAKKFLHTYGSVGFFVGVMAYFVEVSLSIIHADRAVYRSPKRSPWVPIVSFGAPLVSSLLSILPQIIDPGGWRDPNGENCHLGIRRAERWEQGALFCTGLPIFLPSLVTLLFFAATFHHIVTVTKGVITTPNVEEDKRPSTAGKGISQLELQSGVVRMSAAMVKEPGSPFELHPASAGGQTYTSPATTRRNRTKRRKKWFHAHLKAVVISKNVFYKLGTMCIVTAVFGVFNGIGSFINGAKIAGGYTTLDNATIVDALNAVTGTVYFLVMLSITEVRRAILSPLSTPSFLKPEFNASAGSVLSRQTSVRVGATSNM
ncbi:hypothetical protein M427DRAFT_145814, partial [Gonapodya prolifera JEL478]